MNYTIFFLFFLLCSINLFFGKFDRNKQDFSNLKKLDNAIFKKKFATRWVLGSDEYEKEIQQKTHTKINKIPIIGEKILPELKLELNDLDITCPNNDTQGLVTFSLKVCNNDCEKTNGTVNIRSMSIMKNDIFYNFSKVDVIEWNCNTNESNICSINKKIGLNECYETLNFTLNFQCNSEKCFLNESFQSYQDSPFTYSNKKNLLISCELPNEPTTPPDQNNTCFNFVNDLSCTTCSDCPLNGTINGSVFCTKCNDVGLCECDLKCNSNSPCLLCNQCENANCSCPSLFNGIGDFIIISSLSVENMGGSVINGSVAIFPGTGFIGFPPGVVNGTVIVTTAIGVESLLILQTARAIYEQLNKTTCNIGFSIFGTDPSGIVFYPGVYVFPSYANISDGVILNGLGSNSSIFIFRIPDTLNTGEFSKIILINNTQPCNVFWLVESSVNLGANSSFSGVVIAKLSINLENSASINGRLISLGGSITLDTNNVESCVCVS